MPIAPSGNVLPGSGTGNPLTFPGVPTSGAAGTFAGKAAVGALLINTATGILYQNTGTVAAPTWTVVGTQA